MFRACHKKERKNHKIRAANKPFENGSNLKKKLERILTKQKRKVKGKVQPITDHEGNTNRVRLSYLSLCYKNRQNLNTETRVCDVTATSAWI